MKKLFTFLLFLAPVLFLPVCVQAEERPALMITSGYTADDIYYEVYGETPDLSQRSGESITVSRTVTYNGKITPQRRISWQESINGVSYTGILYITQQEYNPSSNKTTAVYHGIIVPK